jgi:GT2 family glycosyltransferase
LKVGESANAAQADMDDNQPSTQVRCDLSVIVLNYNTRDQLRACLDSLAEQQDIRLFSVGTGPRAEVFVVDNASSDGSATMVAADYPWAVLVRSARNGGFAYGNNLALRRCAGRYALVLNPDTVLPPRALVDMLQFMEKHPDAAIAGPKVILPDGRLDLACRRSFPSPTVAMYRMLGLSQLFPYSPRFGQYNLTYLDPDLPAEVDSVMGAFMLVRREAMDEVGLLDESYFMYGEDLDWAYRMKARGWKVLYNPAVVVQHHKGSASRKRSFAALAAFYHAMWVFFRRHYWPRSGLTTRALVTLGIGAHFVWALTKNLLRPAHARRVST